MNLTTSQRLTRLTGSLFQNWKFRSGSASLLVIIAALAALEAFHFGTTEFALRNLMGDWGSGALRWSTILALAFCAMDFAGIARLLDPGSTDSSSREGWYLLGAWALAGAMNTGLTWWGVSLAILNRPVDGTLLMDPMTIVRVVPVFVAVMVWIIRILIIGMLVTAHNKVLHRQTKEKPAARQQPLGFQARTQIPPGYQPLPSQPRARQDPFRQ